ncbi:hypothetical protein ACAW74_14230 [Fibrella sp. WM1]|uniref:hypothetical protein n=1 Tax=Fibrella musci TaxID=3242485 RepID=UPI00351FFEB0
MLLLLLLLAGPVLAQKSVNVTLDILNTKPPRHNNQVGTGQTTDLTGFSGVPAGLTEKVLRTHNTIRGQTSYEAFQRGEITPASWEETKRMLGRDTAYLSPKPLRHRINALVGTNVAGQRVVVVDANNNRDFSDDKVLTYAMTLPQIPKTEAGFYSNGIRAVVDTLPAVSVMVESFDGRRIIQRTVSVKPIPYNNGWTYPDPDAARFHLSLLTHEYRQATTRLLGQPVELVITTIPGLPYNTGAAQVEVREADQPVTKLPIQGSYQPGYAFVVGGHLWEIDRISARGDRLTLLDKGPVEPTR